MKTFYYFLLLFIIIIGTSTIPICINAQTATKSATPGTFESLTRSLSPRSMSTQSTLAAEGLQKIFSATGRYTISADGIGSTNKSMTIRVNKPNAAATVQKAILMSAVTGAKSSNGCVTIGGTPVNWDATVASNFFNNYYADVTSIVKPTIDGFPAGISTLNITECNTFSDDGEALLVVFNDPTATEKTIIIMFGGLKTTGDNFSVTLANPIDPKAPGAVLDMGLGIGFGFQPAGQFSEVSVNGQRLTSSAGGQDDGQPANGALLTVGGIGDLNTNPADPNVHDQNGPRYDDELYSILPFIDNRTTSLVINTLNPSNDDNVFLAYFSLSGAAVIGEGILLSQTTSTGNIGTNHTVKATVLNSNGQPVANRLVKFTITSGPNSGGTFSTNTNSSGEAFFTYNGTGGVGTDNIEACFTNSQSQVSCSNTLSFIWTSVPTTNVYYSKSTGDLHNVLSWGVNPDGSGATPPDFGAGKTFILANRGTNYTLTGNWTVGGKLNIPSGSQLQIMGFTLSVADLIGPGSFNGTTGSNLVITQPSSGGTSLKFVSNGSNLNNLSVLSSATTTLATTLNLYGVLSVQQGTFNTGNALTLKSTASNTARVAPVPTTATITGNVTVERYIPARRAWRLMSAPVGGSQTINQAWQEGATTSSLNPNPNPGFGTHITEGSAANGYDHNPYIAMMSIKKYNSATDTWWPLANTNATSVNSNAFMLFVRGNRGIKLGYNDVPANTTVLRATGPLKIGNQTFPVSATGFTAVPNPFASPINFATITKNNVQNSFYVWDPKLGGTYGVGAWVNVSWNGTSYDVTPAPVSPESQYIQSGQGFMVHSTGVAGSITIKESDKSSTASTNVFRSSNITSGIRINLQTTGSDNSSTTVLDEVFASFNSKYSDKVDNLDVLKFPNTNENLAIVRDGQNLMVDRRSPIISDEVLNLKLWNTEEKSYTFQFNPINLNAEIVSATLEDTYQKTFTPISLTSVSQIYIKVNSDAASKNENRFRLVIAGTKPTIPITGINTQNAIHAFPNPVTGGVINLHLGGELLKGTYNVELVNGLGVSVFKTQMVHDGSAATKIVQLNNRLAKGIYQLRVTKGDIKKTTTVLIN